MIDKLAEKARSQVEKKGPEWIDKTISSARKSLPEGDDAASKAIREAGKDALDELGRHKDSLAHLGNEGLVVLMTYTALGQPNKAAEILRSGEAGWGEVDAAVAAAGDRTEKAKRTEDEMIATAKKIGARVAKTLLPILLAFV